MAEEDRATGSGETGPSISGPRDNVPQESVQDADHFGRENELPDEEGREYWQQVGDEGDQQRTDAPLSSVDPELDEGGSAPRRDRSNTYGSNEDGLTGSGATIDPDRTAGSDQ